MQTEENNEPDDRHGWTHPICRPCFTRTRDGEPVALKGAPVEVCCWCGEETGAGVYVRARPCEPPHCPDRVRAHAEVGRLLGAEVSEPASREASLDVAGELLKQLRVPYGFRVVVVATDESGAYVGVHANTHDADVTAILNAALHGADRVNHG